MTKHLPTVQPAPSPYVDDYPRYLESLIPEQRHYVPRSVTESHTDLEIIEDAWKSQDVVLAYGPTGTGKTSAIYHWAALKGLPVVYIPCAEASGTESLLGAFVPGPDGLRWVDGGVTLAADYPVVLLLDEVNMLRDSLSTALNGALDFRRSIVLAEHPHVAHCIDHDVALTAVDVDEHERCETAEWRGPLVKRLHPETLVVGAYNPGYKGGRPLNEAFEGRWVRLEYGYDSAIEREILRSPALVDLAARLREQIDQGLLRTPIPTSALIKFEAHVERLGYESARELFFQRFRAEERSIVASVWHDAYEESLVASYGYAIVEDGEDNR